MITMESTAGNIIVAPNAAALAIELGRYISTLADEAISQRGRFVIASSGGSLPKTLIEALNAAVYRGEDLRTEAWHVFYADERVVPVDHVDSNHAAHGSLYSQPWWKAPTNQVYCIAPELPASECAQHYEARIRIVGGASLSGSVPALDLILLGMGPDGHTASLFPGHPLLDEASLLVAAITDSPKPPPTRVTFTYPLIAGARAAAVITTGESKADAIALCFDESIALADRLPVARIRVQGGAAPATWFLDASAASKLPA